MRGRARTYTFVFTDIVGSSSQWEKEPARMIGDIEAHHRIVEEAVCEFGGSVFKSLGDGQAAVFDLPRDAVLAAVECQKRLTESLSHLKVRVGVHSGTAEVVEGDFMGSAVNRVARITALASGGQVLVSETCRNLCIDDLGMTVQSLYVGESSLSGHDRPERLHQVWSEGMASVFPGIKESVRHNLTPLDRPFIGREVERRDLNSRLVAGSQRLITVLGFGGMGKTTLARQCAFDSVEAFPDGVWWVDCETLASREDVVSAAAMAIGEPVDTRDPERGLAEVIGEDRVLLIFDCFERIVLHAGALDFLLKACPNLQIVVTSRVVLALAWEYELELRGMTGKHKRAIAQDAISLFVEAAAHVHPGFEVNRANRKQLVELVTTLEFIPLAIVITAGRLRHLTVGEILEQVRTSLLSSVRVSALEGGRHAGLRRVIEMSFEMLDLADRRVAAELSVFEGGFFLKDALAVLAPEDKGAFLDSVGRLRDHSLLVAESRSEGMRYKALDSVREYLVEFVNPDHVQALRSAHANHYALFAQDIRKHFDNDEWQHANELLRMELGNFRASLKNANAPMASSLSFSLCRIFVETGLLKDFQDFAEKALDSSKTNNAMRIEILGLYGVYYKRQNRLPEAMLAWMARKDLTIEVDKQATAETLGDLIGLAIDLQDLEKLQLLLDEYLPLFKHLSTDQKIVHSTLRARCHLVLGNPDMALKMARSLDSQGKLNDATDYSFYCLKHLSTIYHQLGHADDSLFASARALSLAARGGFVDRAKSVLADLYSVAGLMGDLNLREDCNVCLQLLPAKGKRKAAYSSNSSQYLAQQRWDQTCLDLSQKIIGGQQAKLS